MPFPTFENICNQQPKYTFTLSSKTQFLLNDYLSNLKTQIVKPGIRLNELLTKDNVNIQTVDTNTLLGYILNTKKPKNFGEEEIENAGAGNGNFEYSITELKILAEIGTVIDSYAFNDGGHYGSFKSYNATNPLPCVMGFISAPLLNGLYSPDRLAVLAADGYSIDQQKYNALLENRLLPTLKMMSQQAIERNEKLALTLPGLGCGQFAGAYGQTIRGNLYAFLQTFLSQHADELPGIDSILLDTFDDIGLPDGYKETKQFGNINKIQFNCVASSIDPSRKQLTAPENSAANIRVATIVAADLLSWMGNDGWIDSRATDEGVKGMSTFVMAQIACALKPCNPQTLVGFLPSDFKYDPKTGKINHVLKSWRTIAEDLAKFSYANPIISNIFIAPEIQQAPEKSLSQINPLDLSPIVALPLQPVVPEAENINKWYYFSSEETKPLYIKVNQIFSDDLSTQAPIFNGLDNLKKPLKYFTALILLGLSSVKLSDIEFSGINGYVVKLNAEQKALYDKLMSGEIKHTIENITIHDIETINIIREMKNLQPIAGFNANKEIVFTASVDPAPTARPADDVDSPLRPIELFPKIGNDSQDLNDVLFTTFRNNPSASFSANAGRGLRGQTTKRRMEGAPQRSMMKEDDPFTIQQPTLADSVVTPVVKNINPRPSQQANPLISPEIYQNLLYQINTLKKYIQLKYPNDAQGIELLDALKFYLSEIPLNEEPFESSVAVVMVKMIHKQLSQYQDFKIHKNPMIDLCLQKINQLISSILVCFGLKTKDEHIQSCTFFGKTTREKKLHHLDEMLDKISFLKTNAN